MIPVFNPTLFTIIKKTNQGVAGPHVKNRWFLHAFSMINYRKYDC